MELTKAYTSDNFTLGQSEEGMIKTSIMAGNGIFEVASSWLGKSTKKIHDYQVHNLAEMTEEIEVAKNTKYPKLTKEALLYTMKWYRDITLKNGEEAQINFYHTVGKDKTITKEDGEVVNLEDIPGIKFWSDTLFSYTPIQNNSSALTDVSTSDEYYELLNKYFGLYIETHSHNSMSAFASGTDISNSQNDGIQLVFGKLNTNKIEMHTWITVRGVVRECLTDDELLEYAELPEYDLYPTQHTVGQVATTQDKYYFNVSVLDEIQYDLELLEQWDKQIEVKVYARPVYNYGGQLGDYYNHTYHPVYKSKYTSAYKSKNKHTQFSQTSYQQMSYYKEDLDPSIIKSEVVLLLSYYYPDFDLNDPVIAKKY